jgi:hypothetical protein
MVILPGNVSLNLDQKDIKLPIFLITSSKLLVFSLWSLVIHAYNSFYYIENEIVIFFLSFVKNAAWSNLLWQNRHKFCN